MLVHSALSDGLLPEFPRTVAEVLPSFDSKCNEICISKDEWLGVYEMLLSECMFGVALKMLVP